MTDDAERLRAALNLYNEGDLSRAQMLLEMLDPDSLGPDLRVEALYLLGLVYTRRGDPMEAGQCFNSCVRIDRRFFPAFDAWGNLLLSLGDTHGAVEKYRRALAIALPEQSPHVLYNYGQALLRGGYPVRALRKFRESFRRRKHHDAAYMAGVTFLRLGREQGARKWMQRALDLDPANARNHTGYGNALALAGRLEDAIAHYQLAIDRDAACSEAHYNWALALARQGDFARAVQRCKHGLRANPRGFELLAHQAYCLRRMGAYDAALQTARRMRQVMAAAGNRETGAEFADTITVNEAACLRALGRAQQARARLIEQLRTARDASPQSLAELRHQEGKRIRNARCFELTLSARVPSPGYGSAHRPYRRTYWVIASSMKAARRMARELEPTEADVRFEEASGSAALPEADQGVVDRSRAMPI